MAAACGPVRLKGAAALRRLGSQVIQVTLFASPSAKNRASRAVLLTLRLFHRLGWSETHFRFVAVESSAVARRGFVVRGSGEQIFKGDVGLIPVRDAVGERLQ